MLLTNHTNIITVCVYSSFYLSEKKKKDLPECSLLAGQKAFRGEGGDVESGHDDSDVEEAFKGYCSAFQRETGSFIYLYLYKHLDHKHLKHHR